MKILNSLYVLVAIMLLASCGKDGGGLESAGFGGGATGAGGSMARFTIVGNYMYAVDEQNLRVYNLNNPTTPVLSNTVPIGFSIETIYPYQDKLFIGSTSVMYIYSIANPEQPTRLGVGISPQVMRRCDPVIARDTVAYATLRTNGACGGTQSILSIFNIKTPTNPVQVSTRNVQEPYGLGFADTCLYVCDRQGLNVFSIAKAYQPVYLNKLLPTQWFYDVIPYNNTLICWVNDGLILYNIANPANPIYLTKII